jgi:hypothetical protein
MILLRSINNDCELTKTKSIKNGTCVEVHKCELDDNYLTGIKVTIRLPEGDFTEIDASFLITVDYGKYISNN